MSHIMDAPSGRTEGDPTTETRLTATECVKAKNIFIPSLTSPGEKLEEPQLDYFESLVRRH